MNNKTLDEGITVLRNFLAYSDEFSSLKPKWFNNNVLRKEKLI